MVLNALYWLIASVLLLIFELSTPGHFYFLSFSFGSLAGALLSWMGFSLIVQSIGAFAITSISFFFLYSWVKRGATKEFRSNYEALVGKEGIIIKPVEPDLFGQVKINGEIWACKSQHEALDVNALVRVKRIVGAHVVVEKIDER